MKMEIKLIKLFLILNLLVLNMIKLMIKLLLDLPMEISQLLIRENNHFQILIINGKILIF